MDKSVNWSMHTTTIRDDITVRISNFLRWLCESNVVAATLFFVIIIKYVKHKTDLIAKEIARNWLWVPHKRQRLLISESGHGTHTQTISVLNSKRNNEQYSKCENTMINSCIYVYRFMFVPFFCSSIRQFIARFQMCTLFSTELLIPCFCFIVMRYRLELWNNWNWKIKRYEWRWKMKEDWEKRWPNNKNQMIPFNTIAFVRLYFQQFFRFRFYCNGTILRPGVFIVILRWK